MWFGNRNGIRKKLAVLVLTVLCTLSAAFPVTCRVNAQGSAKLTASVCTAGRGEQVTVAFTLEENPGIWGLKFRVDYDHSALRLLSTANGKVFDGDEVTPPESLNAERFVFLGCSDKLEDILGSGEVMTLTFAVMESAPAGKYPVSLEMVQAVNLAGEDVDIAVQNGMVIVKMDAPEAPSGFSVRDCTNPDDNDGAIFGVNAGMEYRREGDYQWVSVAGNSISGLASGTYYIRMKETDTALAGDQAAVVINGYEEEEPVVETVDQETADSQKTATGTKTGDSSNPALWIALELLSAGIMAAMILSRRTENSRKQNRSS